MNKQDIEQKVIDCLSDLYVCGRVWEAWNYNTMTRDDFSLAREDENIVYDFTEMIMEIIATLTTDNLALMAQVETQGVALDKACKVLAKLCECPTSEYLEVYAAAGCNEGCADCWKAYLLEGDK
jgi:hypothetical protein